MWAYDLDETGRKGFLCCGYKMFVEKYYREKKQKCFYEIVRENVPVKFYLDVESVDPQTMGLWDQFKSRLESFFHENYGCDPEITVLDSSTPEKLSKHVIVQMFFYTVVHVSTVVVEFMEYAPEFVPIIDPAVYTKNRCFRILYSSKFGKNRPLKLDGCCEQEYDHYDLFKTLICPFIPRGMWTSLVRGDYNPFLYTLHRPSIKLAPENPRKRSHPSEHVGILDIPRYVRTYLETVCGAKIVSVHKREDNSLFFILDLVCPWKGEVHKSNHQFCTISADGEAFFICSDSNCPRVIYRRLRILQNS